MYADWLQSQGGDDESRGELIMVQYQLAREHDPRRRAELEAIERDLIRALAHRVRSVARRLDWHMGFIHHAEIELTNIDDLEVVLGDRASRFLRSLRIDKPSRKKPDWEAVTAELIALGHDTVQSLRIADWGTLWTSGSASISNPPANEETWAIYLGDFTGLIEAYPALATLHLGGRADLPHGAPLREITITAQLRPDMCAALMDGWSQLETLRIWASPSQTTGAELHPMWSGHAMPKLRELAICSMEVDALLERVLKEPAVSRLSILDLRHTPINDAHVETLLEKKLEFSHLDDLRLARSHLTQLGKERADALVLGLRPGETSLVGYARRGDSEGIRRFVANFGAHPQEIGDALLPAADAGHMQVLLTLLNAGADPNTRDRGWKATPLERACMNGHMDCVELLLERNADPNLLDRFGYSPLMRAAFSGHANICWLLLERGAFPGFCNTHGHDALMLAAGEGRADVVRVWLERGLDTTREINGNTALTEAERFQYWRVVELLTPQE